MPVCKEQSWSRNIASVSIYPNVEHLPNFNIISPAQTYVGDSPNSNNNNSIFLKCSEKDGQQLEWKPNN